MDHTVLWECLCSFVLIAGGCGRAQVTVSGTIPRRADYIKQLAALEPRCKQERKPLSISPWLLSLFLSEFLLLFIL